MGYGVSAIQNTLLHAGRIQFRHQIGKNGCENCQVHEVKEERDEGDRNDHSATFLESHPLEEQSNCKVVVAMALLVGTTQNKYEKCMVVVLGAELSISGKPDMKLP